MWSAWISASVIAAASPVPSVVRSTVGSCRLTRKPSFVGRGSVSTKSMPSAMAARTAETVSSGAITPSAPPTPRWPLTRRVGHAGSVSQPTGT